MRNSLRLPPLLFAALLMLGAVLHAQQSSPANDWKELGAKSYRTNCLMCHGPAGAGSELYPPLTVADDLIKAEGGKDYLVLVQLFGLASERYRMPMTPMAHLRDAEIAAVLNHVLTSFGNQTDEKNLYSAEDVAKLRNQKLTPKEVGAKRPATTQPATP